MTDEKESKNSTLDLSIPNDPYIETVDKPWSPEKLPFMGVNDVIPETEESLMDTVRLFKSGDDGIDWLDEIRNAENNLSIFLDSQNPSRQYEREVETFSLNEREEAEMAEDAKEAMRANFEALSNHDFSLIDECRTSLGGKICWGTGANIVDADLDNGLRDVGLEPSASITYEIKF